MTFSYTSATKSRRMQFSVGGNVVHRQRFPILMDQSFHIKWDIVKLSEEAQNKTCTSKFLIFWNIYLWLLQKLNDCLYCGFYFGGGGGGWIKFLVFILIKALQIEQRCYSTFHFIHLIWEFLNTITDIHHIKLFFFTLKWDCVVTFVRTIFPRHKSPFAWWKKNELQYGRESISNY